MTGRTRARGPISAPAYLVLGALTMITPLSTNIYVPALPEITAYFGSTPASVEATVSATLIGIAVGQLVIGTISDRLGRRGPALVGTAAFVVLSILCGLAGSLPLLIVLRFLQGFAGASGVVLARASIRDRTSGKASAQALSRLLIVAALAPVIAPLLGAIALHVMSWQWVFGVLALMGAIAFTMAVRWFPETLPRAARHATHAEGLRAARGRLFRDPYFWAYVSVTGIIGVIAFSWLTSSSFMFAQEYGIGPTGYSIIVGSTSLAFLVSAWINSRAVMRIGPRRALLRGLVIIALGAAALTVAILVHAPLALVIACALISFGSYGGMIANAQALAMHDHPDAAGTASAFLGAAQFVLGALVAPTVAHFFGVTWAVGASMSLAALAALVIVAIARPPAPALR